MINDKNKSNEVHTYASQKSKHKRFSLSIVFMLFLFIMTPDDENILSASQKILKVVGFCQTAKDFVLDVEMRAREIAGDISDKEYLVRRKKAGNMPRLNRGFEVMGIHHSEHMVPSKVLKSVREKEEKERTAILSN